MRAPSFMVMTGVFTLVYKTLPDAYVAWGDAWVGAVVTAFLFDIGSLLLSIQGCNRYCSRLDA